MWQIAWTSGGTVRDGRLAERTRTSLSNFSHGVRKGVEVVTRRLLQGLLQGVQGFCSPKMLGALLLWLRWWRSRNRLRVGAKSNAATIARGSVSRLKRTGDPYRTASRGSHMDEGSPEPSRM